MKGEIKNKFKVYKKKIKMKMKQSKLRRLNKKHKQTQMKT